MPDAPPPIPTVESAALLAVIDAGFCLVEVVFDGAQAVDYRFVEVNAAFERLTGLSGATGRLASDLAPDLDRYWYDLYAQIAVTGERVKVEHRSTRSGRWFEVSAQRVGDAKHRRIGVLFTDITDRRADAEALQQSRERLELALAAGGGIGTWDWDIVADRVTADARFAERYGVDPALAARGAPIADFFTNIHPDDLPRTQTVIDEAIRTGADFADEYRILQRDGSIRWGSAQGRCQYAPDGTPLRLPGVTFDVTDRKRAEARQAALLALGDRLRDLVDPAEISHAGAGVLGQALGVDRVGYGLIDKVAETITIDRDWTAPGVDTLAGVLHFRDFGSYIDDLKAGITVAVADARLDARTSLSAAELEAINARAFVNMPLVEQGGLVALLYANHGVTRHWDDADLSLMREIAERVRDATERARAQEARRAAQDQILTFAQALPIQIWAATAAGALYFVNQRVLDYSGAAPGSLDGPTAWGRNVHPDDIAAAGAAWAHAIATTTDYQVEFRVRRSDGAYRWFLVRAVPVRNADGAVTGWVGTNTDIDDQRRQGSELARLASTLEAQVQARTADLMLAEDALRQSQKMEAVGQLTGGIAHDFNNLLTGISGSLEMLGIRIAQGRIGDIERYAHAAQGAAKRAAALTHRLLAFSRRQTLDPRPTDANRLVAGMEELIRRTVGPAITVEVVAAGGLWPTLVDPPQLENAILNLAINARDAMPDGGRLTIETGNRWLDERAARERDLPPGQYVSLCVSDTGTGMPADVIAKAFDPFFTTKPLGEGTGLGLSMIYGFARQSGGQVRIYSELGEGAMLCLYLPRHHGSADGAEDADLRTEVPRASKGETVLFVDDEPTVRMLITEILEELGYAAIEAADGSSGLAVLRSDVRIDLLVTDVGLPGGMNGRQMADAARIARPDLKVLFITGYAENAVVGNGHLDHGMHVMTKPFAMDALALRICELITNDR